MTDLAITSIGALLRRLKSRKGQSLVEYALVLSFISLLSVAVLSVMGAQIRAICLPIIHALQVACTGL
jgi:Flp pilus assembly pilin Flp